MPAVLCVGVAVHDFVFGLDAMPTRAEKYRATSFASVGGGCAGNAAAAIARLGRASRLAGRFGDDGMADLILGDLAREGVDCRHARRFAGQRSSVSAILVDAAGERLIVNYRDPGLPQAPDFLPDPLDPDIGAVLADTRWAGGAGRAMALAAQAGVPGILDAEAPIREVMDALALASHVAFSAQGLADLTGETTIAAGLRAARAHVGGWLAATDGPHGCFVLAGDRLLRVPTIAVDVVDTLGAGDVWHGAFALRLAEGADEIDAVAFANIAAALKCTRFGGRAGTPSRGDVDALLASRPLGVEVVG